MPSTMEVMIAASPQMIQGGRPTPEIRIIVMPASSVIPAAVATMLIPKNRSWPKIV